MRSIFAESGVSGFYRGLGANLIGVIPEKAIKLAANEYFREMLEQPDGSIRLHHEVIAGIGLWFATTSGVGLWVGADVCRAADGS